MPGGHARASCRGTTRRPRVRRKRGDRFPDRPARFLRRRSPRGAGLLGCRWSGAGGSRRLLLPGGRGRALQRELGRGRGRDGGASLTQALLQRAPATDAAIRGKDRQDEREREEDPAAPPAQSREERDGLAPAEHGIGGSAAERRESAPLTGLKQDDGREEERIEDEQYENDVEHALSGYGQPGNLAESGPRFNDRGPSVGIEACAAHEYSIDTGLREECGGVSGVHAPAVQDGDLGAPAELTETLADDGMDGRCIGGRGVPTGADRPYGLVRDHELPRVEPGKVRECGVELPEYDCLGATGFPLVELLSHAEHDLEAGGQQRGRLSPGFVVGFTEHVPPLRVPHESAACSRLDGDGGGHFAGERPLRPPMDVLRADRDIAAVRADRGRHLHARGGREEPELPPVGGRDAGDESLEKRAGRSRPVMHFPVCGEDAAPHQASSSAATPGSGLPSRNSSDAPPPVETWVIWSARPAAATAAAESPPPTTVTAPRAVACAIALATAKVP